MKIKHDLTTTPAKSQQQPLTTPTASSGGKPSASSITVGPDQKQVFYSVTYEDGKTQQYMMLCPKEMDQDTLIQTLVKQISADPNAKGKKTIRIQKPASTQGTPGLGTLTQFLFWFLFVKKNQLICTEGMSMNPLMGNVIVLPSSQ